MRISDWSSDVCSSDLRELELLVRVQRRCADAPDGGLDVLGPDRCGDLRGRELKARELVGIEPDAHRVVERAEQVGVAPTVDALERVDNIYRRIVAQVMLVVGAVGGIELEDLQQT